MKLVAPRGSASSPVPTYFQMPARVAGGTVAMTRRNELRKSRGAVLTKSAEATVCQRIGRTGTTHSRPGGLKARRSRTFSWLSAM